MLRNDQLARVAVTRASKRMVKNANGPEDVADNLDLAREVRGVTKDHLGLSLEAHAIGTRHGSLDANSLITLVEDLVDVGVKHVGTSVDGREAGEALRKLSETVERVDVGGLSVAGDRVTVEADALDGLGCLAGNVDVFAVGRIEGHGVADEVSGSSLEAKLVVNILHGALVDVETFCPLLMLANLLHSAQSQLSPLSPLIEETNPCVWQGP